MVPITEDKNIWVLIQKLIYIASKMNKDMLPDACLNPNNNTLYISDAQIKIKEIHSHNKIYKYVLWWTKDKDVLGINLKNVKKKLQTTQNNDFCCEKVFKGFKQIRKNLEKIKIKAQIVS